MPPDTGGYMVAGYVVTTVILLAYVVGLWRRAKQATGDR
jgi:hypothetical protein